MERTDRELIEQVMKNDMRLKRLYDQHLKLERSLKQFQGRSFLTTIEQRDERNLKKKKLNGVDEMMRLLAEIKQPISANSAEQSQAA